MRVKLGYKHKGELKYIEFGTHPSDYTFSQYLDFCKWEDLFNRANRISRGEEEETEDFAGSLADAIGYLIEGLGVFCSGDLHTLPYNIDGNIGEQWAAGKIGDVFDELSLIRLYYYFDQLFSGEEFDFEGLVPDKAFEFEYKGEAFYLEPDRAKRAVSRGAVATYETMEVLEVTEIERWLDGKIKDKGDPEKALEYERELRAMAVLARKDGEELPFNPGKRKGWIEERARHFMDLPMDVVLGVRFFLAITYEGLKMSPYTAHFLTENQIQT